MTFLVAYIIKSIIAGGILYAWYLVALRNRKFHVYNRVYLLSATVASLVLPFANLSIFHHSIPISGFTPISHRSLPSDPTVAIACPAIISLFLLTVMIIKIARVYRIKKVNGYVKRGSIDFIRTRLENAPFSFLNNLFWREDMSTTDSNGKRIFKHEMTHIRQRHTYDKLFVQAITCIGWMNPFFWLIQKELNVVHEFLADVAAIEEGDTGSFAMMLLQCHNRGEYLDPSHHFFQSPVLRRLNMVASPRDSSPSYARKCLALPLIALLLFLFSFKMSPVKNDIQIVQRIEKASPSSTPQAARTYYIRYRYWTVM
jgi:hypothetical protein